MQHLTPLSFQALALEDCLKQALSDSGIHFCTPIQAATLCLTRGNLNVAGQAQTGTGKTLAFLLTTMDFLLKHPVEENKKGPWAVIFLPTRELAMQVFREAQIVGKYSGLKSVLIYGGLDYEKQRSAVQKPFDILICTPGRTIDYYKQGAMNFDNVEVVVIDEADRMFDLGFISDLRYLLRKMPPPEQRLNLLFSATLSARVTELAYEYLGDPQIIRINPHAMTTNNVVQQLCHVAEAEKPEVLKALLKHQIQSQKTVIFVNTKRTGETLCRELRQEGINATHLSGDVPQNTREKMLSDFKQGICNLLIATDVAARGLHIDDVEFVVNYDLPQDAANYVHRIGRTARIGKAGRAISLACERYVYSLEEIEQYLGHPIEAVLADEFLTSRKNDDQNPPAFNNEPALF